MTALPRHSLSDTAIVLGDDVGSLFSARTTTVGYQPEESPDLTRHRLTASPAKPAPVPGLPPEQRIRAVTGYVDEADRGRSVKGLT